ncbi:MarR family winged helix-turn-helix transcriptional regulator [Pseudomonas mangiferae]|uniref:Winged helix-turn-helix transcriptional regulator n=1 Tax=Pseudomonas mangiferae TaxID=2593654 RepID=A0A553H538_9PSED|nr:helix-turn-helix domain-containing protein [Pseudomonas mangiferae]TRX76837.1 winged helix-turn-helix transcriptional regulator [Pseudomonas mangiferae]
MPDLKKAAAQQQAMEAFFFGYQAFTARPDAILARRGLSRVHHRILFFIARYPGLSVKQLLGYLDVSKQALSVPLRQLIEMKLVVSVAADDDKRRRLLGFTAEGARLERTLRREQTRLLERALALTGEQAMAGWLDVNCALGAAHERDGQACISPSAPPAAPARVRPSSAA